MSRAPVRARVRLARGRRAPRCPPAAAARISGGSPPRGASGSRQAPAHGRRSPPRAHGGTASAARARRLRRFAALGASLRARGRAGAARPGRGRRPSRRAPHRRGAVVHESNPSSQRSMPASFARRRSPCTAVRRRACGRSANRSRRGRRRLRSRGSRCARGPCCTFSKCGEAWFGLRSPTRIVRSSCAGLADERTRLVVHGDVVAVLIPHEDGDIAKVLRRFAEERELREVAGAGAHCLPIGMTSRKQAPCGSASSYMRSPPCARA